MKTSHFAAGLALMFLVATGVAAQHHDQQFNEHDRQVTQDWYKQHQNNAPAGFRSSDRLSAQQEQRLQAGQKLDRELQRHTHSVPRDLGRKLPPAPKHHKYVAIGQHVALIDTRDNTVRDVIHVHDQHH
jgi:Ni/Co efflux regulator RcnB